jgi:hypothetical protein
MSQKFFGLKKMKELLGTRIDNNKTVNIGVLIALTAVSAMAFSPDSLADLNATLTQGNTFIRSIGRTLNLLAGLTGAYFVLSGLMEWKKSSSEHGGGQGGGFKAIAVPIVAGALLVAFTSVVAATSSTFGFASSSYTGV